MANEFAKYKNSRRRHKTDVAIARQLKIAKQHTSFANENTVIREPHRLAKHHAMDCGNSECYLCGNPRKTHKDKLTVQEHRLFQDLDSVNHHHSNGLTKDTQ
jgi:hypothetical protein